ncbi:restriction endonuclease subunit S [Enterococcus faecalis]|uniref:restriction endonuclease subunit S n=1 Tax=Enterococcus faecalis TaxID=1351 RepID=UPI002DC0605E|nr:restriction endonuclease subunit S [Enterococcus faecalis]MEB7776213.1 restriction endonuclease subunit S [Enterococcus faecalis]
MSNDTQPEIRFPGFTEDWEERKLGELTESFDGKRVPIDSDLRISGKYPYYGATGIIDYVDDYIFNGEYVLLAEDGANIIMRNYPVAYLTQGKFWLNNHAHIMRMRNGSNYFLVQVLEKIDYKKYNTGTAQPKLNSKIVKNIELKIPHIEEQQQIGNFFKQLDDIIALHQRKLDLLKETKKGFLQKMFPENGAKVPEIRFPGFTGDWEQRKLGELTKIKTGSSDLQDADAKGIYPFFVRSEIIERSNRYIFDGEAILIPGEGRLGEIYHYINGKFDFHQRVYKISDFQYSDTDGKYILYYMQKYFKKHAMKYTVKATVDSLRLPMLTEFDIKIPSLDEQRAISSFFSNLDQAITLHQRKLDLLKETKKGFLQKMFV